MRTNDRAYDRIASAAERYCIEGNVRGFEQSLSEFTDVAREVADLGAVTGLGKVGHGDMEKHLSMRGRDIAREMMQDALNAVSAEEEIRTDVIGPGGSVLRYPRRRVRSLETLFGPVWISRLGYRDRGTGSVFPLDAQLNLPTTRYSHGLQELAAWVLSHGSYDLAIEHISKLTSAIFHRRQMEDMVRQYVADFHAYYAQSIVTSDSEAEDGHLLILSVDGKGIVMRHEDLREETKRRAEGANHKLQRRLSRGEKRNRKRMAEVVVVYDVATYRRSAEDIVLTAHRPKDAPRPSSKRVWASVEKESADVMDDAMEEVKRRDPQGQRTLVILLDGLADQIRKVSSALTLHGREDAIIVQDFFHVAE
jgi:hypothetical protein